jgi:hypothetical protein
MWFVNEVCRVCRNKRNWINLIPKTSNSWTQIVLYQKCAPTSKQLSLLHLAKFQNLPVFTQYV